MSDPSKHRAETPRASGSLVRRLVPAIIAAVLVTGGVTAAAVVDPFADDPAEPTRRTVGMSIGGAMTAQLLEDAPQPVVAGEKLRLTKARKAELKRLEEQRKARLKAERIAAKRAAQPFSFQIASFNVLGSNHTGPGGARRNFPAAGTRTPQGVGVLRSHGTDVVGLQEAKPDQLGTIMRMTGFVGYPGPGAADPDNTVLWDPSRFELVSGSTFPIVFMNRTRPQTIVRLRDKPTQREFYVVNMHPSAGHDARNTSTRVAGWRRGVAEVNALRQSGLPVLVTGDMNDRAAFFCAFLPPTGFVAAVGGSTSGGCRPPGRMPVDWIVGSPDVSFSGYVIDESTVNRRISDHFYISATATVAPAGD